MTEVVLLQGGVGPPWVLQSLGPGFYLWMASLLVLLVGPIVLRATGDARPPLAGPEGSPSAPTPFPPQGPGFPRE